MTYLLDTNIVSELPGRPARTNAGVTAWIAGVVADQINISVITLFELERGRGRQNESLLTSERRCVGG